MLADFFKLDEPFEELPDEAALMDLLRGNRTPTSLLYRPDNWPAKQKGLKGYKFKNVSLSKTTFDSITFTDCTFEDCLFIGSRFISVEFHRCKFINSNFYKVSFSACYLDPATISLDKKYRRSHANIGTQLYQQLFDDASRSRQSDFAMKADIEFRKWKRWQLTFDERRGKIRKRDRFSASVSSLLYEWITGFGYRPLRFIFATVLLFSFFSFLNMKLLPGMLEIDGQVASAISYVDSIFYTFSMMTVLGFSTVLPQTGAAKIIAVSEALVGVGWLGLFTSLLVKRFIK